MHVGVDGSVIWGARHWGGGLVRYTLEIVSGLLRADSNVEFTIYCLDEIPAEWRRLDHHGRFRVFTTWNRKVWQQAILPLAAIRDKLDVMFFPANSAAAVFPVRTVATIHDLHPYVVPEAFNRNHSLSVHGSRWRSVANRLYWRRMAKILAAKDGIIVPSRSTRADLERILGTPRRRIHVIPEAVDGSRFSPASDPAELRLLQQECHVPGRYLLCVGTHAYKNLEGSLKAFGFIRQDFADLKLVIAGSLHPLDDRATRAIRLLSLEDDVMFTGFFPETYLAMLYRQAELLLFPSFYEGFGLPVLEAFACGTIVVASDRGSIAEVAKGAAVLIDPTDPSAIAAAATSLLRDPSRREMMRRRGLEIAREYSWPLAAQRTLAALRSVAGRNSPGLSSTFRAGRARLEVRDRIGE